MAYKSYPIQKINLSSLGTKLKKDKKKSIRIIKGALIILLV